MKLIATVFSTVFLAQSAFAVSPNGSVSFADQKHSLFCTTGEELGPEIYIDVFKEIDTNAQAKYNVVLWSKNYEKTDYEQVRSSANVTIDNGSLKIDFIANDQPIDSEVLVLDGTLNGKQDKRSGYYQSTLMHKLFLIERRIMCHTPFPGQKPFDGGH